MPVSMIQNRDYGDSYPIRSPDRVSRPVPVLMALTATHLRPPCTFTALRCRVSDRATSEVTWRLPKRRLPVPHPVADATEGASNDSAYVRDQSVSMGTSLGISPALRIDLASGPCT